MDSEAKSKKEKKIVIALLAVFGLVLLSTARSLGVFGTSHTPKAQEILIEKPADTIRDALKNFRDQLNMDEIEHPKVVEAPLELRVVPLEYTAHDVRDPLVSLLPSEEEEERSVDNPEIEEAVAPSLSIQGLLWNTPRPQAIINNELYDVGDLVDGARITGISREGVTVEFQGSTYLNKPVEARQGMASGSSPVRWR